MIPSSFAPMILKMILPKVTDHFAKLFKLDKVLKYVEEDNETDLKVVKLEKQIQILAAELGKVEDRLNKVEILNGK